MRKFTLFIASLLLALGAKADFTQTFLRGGTFWGSAVENYPSGVTSVIDEHYGSGQVHCASVDVQVLNPSDITVTFEHTNGYHKLNILGVVLEDNKGNVCYYDYHKGTAGGSLINNEYTLSNVSSGIYTLRYYVYNLTSGDNDKVVSAGGNITIKNADELTPVSRNGWGVTASSQETSGDPGQATNAIDGNNSTFWHTVYAETYPHWIEFDMTKAYTIYSFDYVSRFDDTNKNGNILDYKLYVSNSAMNGNYENATLAASGTFVYGQGVNHLIDLEMPVAGRYVALVAESGTRGDWAGNAAANAANCAEFNVYGIEVPAETNEEKKEELRSKIEWVIAFDQVLHMIGDAVGQYSSSNDDFAYDFANIQIFCDYITKDTSIEDIEEKIAELEDLIATFSPNMPVNGKAYTFKNVQKDSTTVCWFTYKDGKIELTKTEAEATAFVCRELPNGKYAFVINEGKYLTWRGNDSGNTGVRDAYDVTEAYTDVIITKMGAAAGNVQENCTNTRYVTVSARRNANNEIGVVTIAKNGPAIDKSNSAYFNNNHSSAFIMDEVVYANKPTLNAVGTSALLTSDLHNKAMATFSAPFPTVVPAGVTAYYATDGDGYVSLQKIDGAIPANTGVILVGENANNAIMVPAAGETIATVENNVLAHSAGANVEISAGCGYILTAKNGVAGFYKATAGKLTMNKAYIAVNGAQESVEIRLPGTTGIEKVEIRNEKEEIFDLTGRRVNEITKAGIYIVNGKKVLVK